MAEQRRERKVVTVVFCDLVGFTQRAESLDPEDVEALLGPYHERLRTELERHGGTVEKFIGDAVMALFGAPTAHEDDAERAVRACLAIRDWALDEDDVQVRIAVTTGEALIRLDARPEAGEGMASGDVVNTAARLQNAAPVNGILADETTYRATRQVVDYKEATAVEAKGKAEPIAVWEAQSARARFGVDVAHEARAGLVGRDRELGVLEDAFGRARHERTPQLVTLVGVPGIGKSRLVYELSRIVDAEPELITWRQGRCLAYGDGVTLWALGEIVKAQAGIAEQDTPDEVAAKVRQAVVDALPASSDASWIESQLLALLGQAGETELAGDQRGVAFAAWRRFLEALAEQRPLVLVFEDLHWADEGLLDFVDELVDWVSDVPLLVVGTARPELLERRPGWGGGKLNATTIALAPLSDEQTAKLIGKLLARPVLAADSQQALLERAGGNPLYAEQFAELFLERGSTDELPLPETLQGIIAARLDGLSSDAKELLRDAAVVGKVFWMSALRRDPSAASSTLHSLERKGFVRRQKRSSVDGESEFAFAHALVRDVAYGQIARADRAEKHGTIAEWLESLGRPEDHAEMLAHHWSSALEFARAAGGNGGAELAERARLALREAGNRAFSLNSFLAAERYYGQALELWPAEHAERAELLFRRAHALYFTGDDRREAALEEARDALLAADERERASEAEAFLAHVAWYRGRGDSVWPHLERAEELAGNEPSAARARVLSFSARTRMLSDEPEDAIPIAEEALAIADALGLNDLRAHALATIGTSKNFLDDPSGVLDLERALEIALAADSPIAGSIVNNLAVDATFRGDLVRTDELYADALRLSERFGDGQGHRFVRANRNWLDYMLGHWDRALEDADRFTAECEAGSPHVLEVTVRDVRGHIREARGETRGALEDHVFALALARDTESAQHIVPALSVCAASHAESGQLGDAHLFAAELVEVVRSSSFHPALAAVAPFAEELGVRAELLELVTPPTSLRRPWRDAAELALELDFSGAADIYAEMPNRALEARFRFHAGRTLIGSGRRAEGEAELERAVAFYRTVAATYFLRRAESLLAKTA